MNRYREYHVQLKLYSKNKHLTCDHSAILFNLISSPLSFMNQCREKTYVLMFVLDIQVSCKVIYDKSKQSSH